MKRMLPIGMLLLVGCAAETTPDEGTSAAAVSATTFYDCSGAFGDDSLSRLEIGITDERLSITDLSKDAMPPDTGSFDPDFNPTPAFAGAVRYQGFPVIHDEFSGSDVAHFEVVVTKDIVARKSSGKIFFRTSGSGGDSTAYNCKAKDAPVAVDPARRARLACSLDRLICKDDNPPGETCLGDLFVNQVSAGKATMRLTFMEHFGVSIVERKDQLGESETLKRTATGFSGAWKDGTKLDLTYRAGVTYTGTYTSKDGEAGTLKCNDLAMFD